MNHQSFSGKSTSIGNSNGFRFDAALFKANPEFFGEVRGTVLAPGQMLVSVVPAGGQPPEPQDEEQHRSGARSKARDLPPLHPTVDAARVGNHLGHDRSIPDIPDSARAGE